MSELKTTLTSVRFEAFTAVTMKNGVFWDVRRVAFLRGVRRLLVTSSVVLSSSFLVNEGGAKFLRNFYESHTA
jgi:hypothetical protein